MHFVIENKPFLRPQIPGEFKQSQAEVTDAVGSKEKDVTETKKQRDFVLYNALDVIKNSTERADKVKEVAAKKLSHTRFVEKSGYGKVPEYLRRVQKEIKEEKRLLKHLIDSGDMHKSDEPASTQAETGIYSSGSTLIERLSEERRQGLLSALKRKWAVVNKKFQSILSAQTLIKLKEKEKFEKNLKQLEKDIDLLSKTRIAIS